jgi:hypothetical protein
MAWNKFKSLGFILADKYQKLDRRKAVLESCIFPVLLYGAQTRLLMKKEETAPNLSAEDGMENKCDGHCGSGSQSQV